MADPAFQLMGEPLPGEEAGEFGTSDFGVEPFGGNVYDLYTLPGLVLGSDDLTKTDHVRQARVVHYRQGVPIGGRVYQDNVIWRVRTVAVTVAEHGDSLKIYFDAWRFYLRPSGEGGPSYTVIWVEDEFQPAKRLRGGKMIYDFHIQVVG